MSDERNASNVTTNTNPDTTGAQGMASEPVISVRDLTVSFASEAGTVRAVRGMNFDLYPGKTLGIVGESGSGKSVTSMAIMGLLDKNASVKGSITYHGEELLSKSDLEMSEIRGKGIAMVFQDPLSALTPVFSIGDQIKEALVTHNPKMTEQQIHDRSIELMNLVGIPDPEDRLKSFPHEFSGGMRQRVMIAMAIANDPDVIIADEPTTALDVTIQAQVLEVLRKAQRETGAAVIFITHDLGVIAGVADDIVVMYAGRPVEKADVDSIFDHPAMPYTMGLLGAVPRSDREHKIPREKRRELRSAVQYVFQDPMSSLDPRLPIYDILAEPMKVQHYSKEQIRERIGELMRLVELNPDQVDRFPTQFSGGQRQRIAIARALSVNPKLVLLDEPVSALDVSIQAGVINLLEDLQNKLGVAYLFVAHNLSVVRHISSRVAVMYLGRIVESGDTEDVFEHPLHPYTQALISAVPVPDPKAERTRQRIVLQGEVPSPTETFEGCPFMGRCPLMPKLSAEQQARCRGERPALRPYDTSRPSGHQVACHFA
ncbi:Oligopeptide transport ATP-binding protein oppD [Bifidobacterium longum subsp. longum]|nr:Oligopeptide transport ATP-binding protein oppD [Bifidobacterium longum subsp. longum]